jgi:hypothetical protein
MPLLIKTVDGKNAVKILAAENERMKESNAAVARWALG